MRLIFSSQSAFFLRVALCCGLSLSLAAHAALVVTVTTGNNSAVAQALRAIRHELSQLVPDTRVLSVDATSANQPPDLVLTLGSKAVNVAQQRFSNVPLLACLILDGEIHNAYPNASAIVMRHSIEEQLYWHQRILPKVKNIGIVYSPKHNEKQVELIEKAAELRGLEVVKVPVNSVQDLPSALKAVKRNADSILAIPDPVVYSGKTAKGVLLFSFRNKIPLAGLSKAWVKAGALYALDWDYLQLGGQCAGEAVKLLAGQKEGKLTVADAQFSRYSINQRTANAMKLTIDKSMLDGASFVFQ